MATNQMRREAAKRKLERQQERRAAALRRRKRIALITTVAVVVVVVAGVVVLTNLPSAPAAPAAAAPTAAAVTPASIPTAVTPVAKRATPLPATVSCNYPAAGQAAKPVNPPPGADITTAGTVTLTLQTTAGAIPLTLDRSLAPCTVNSIVSLVQQGYYNGSSCHRLTTDAGLQVLQCGDPTGTGSGGPGYTVPDETYPEMKYGRGVLAMANTGQPNSGGGQFFMIYGDASGLGPSYTVFGSINPEGLQVIDTVAKAGHDGSFDPNPGGGKPITPVTIQTAALS